MAFFLARYPAKIETEIHLRVSCCQETFGIKRRSFCLHIGSVGVELDKLWLHSNHSSCWHRQVNILPEQVDGCGEIVNQP